jgi:hypothetical protein
MEVFVDRKGKLNCENLLSYSWINYSSSTSITRIKVIFQSTKIFINLVKVLQKVQDERRKGENDYSTNKNLYLSI